MSHDPTKIKLGGVDYSGAEITNHDGDPETFEAGLAVRQKSDGKLTLAKADGLHLGISLGVSLSDAKRTSVARTGYRVPIQLTDDSNSYAYVVKGAKVYIDDATGKANIVDDGNVTTTISDGMYVSGVMDGVKPDGTLVKVALVDMPGGL